MSNRNFDSSYLTRRQGERQIAKNIVTKSRQNSSTSYNNISTNYDASIINQIREGQSMTITKGLTCTTVEPGCPCGNSNIITYPPGPIIPPFNPSISYILPPVNPECLGNSPVTYSVVFGPGTPTGGTFSISPSGPNPITVNPTTGLLSIPGSPPGVDPEGIIYTVTYTVGTLVLQWSQLFGYC
jgi:hypothetical protein